MCSGSVSVLPTILYLTTGVLKQLAPQGVTTMSPVVSTALHCLKVLCSSPLSRDQLCADGWKQHLQSAFMTIIEYSSPGLTLIQQTFIQGIIDTDVPVLDN
jgi:HEAT repeat-containing protein 5